MMKITICGGGSLGHICIGVFSQCPDVEVSLLTRRPECWSSEIAVTDVNGKVMTGRLKRVSASAAEVIPAADIVLFCLPGFLIEETLLQIKPYLSASAAVGTVVSSTGFFYMAHKVLAADVQLFGFQRAPFIARVKDYGRTANLLGYKSSLAIACENVPDQETFRQQVERLFATPVTLLNSYLEASLTNSNPILHTGRLYCMWCEWAGEALPQPVHFYQEWDEKSAQMLIDMDQEFLQLLHVLPIDQHAIPSLLEYYESHDAASLAAKLRSIKAFQPILAPMKETEAGWIPDFDSRYFTEDFPFGLRWIVELAQQHHIEVPVLEKVYEWGMGCCKKY